MRFRLAVDGEPHELEVVGHGEALLVRVDGAEYRVKVVARGLETEVRIGRRLHRIRIEGTTVVADGSPHQVVVEELPVIREGTGLALGTEARGVYEVRPPMPGRIVRVPIEKGMRLRRGQTLVVLEAMKMQNEIPSPADAIVREVHVREGESISADRLIAVLESV